MSDETTRGGSRIFRHQAAPAGAGVVASDEAAAAAVTALIGEHIGAAENVFHELVSELVHLDVHIVAPSDGDDAYTLFTTGMSDRAMTMPEGLDETPFAELMIRLPATWRLTQEDAGDERWFWPVRWLKTLARLPHQYGTWLGLGHTIPNGDPPRPVAPESPFVGFLIAGATSLPEDGDLARVASGKEIRVLAVYPLTAAEMQHKLDEGADALIERMMDAGLSDVVEPGRKSCV